jgi:FdhD protein
MTLGAAPEALAIGFLRNQRLVKSIEEIVSVQVDWEVNAAVVTTRDGLADLERKTEKRTATTGCGQGPCSATSWRTSSPCSSTTTCASTSRRSSGCSTPCACTSRSTSRPAPCTAARSPRARDPHLRRGRGPPQRGRRDRRLDVARGIDGRDKIFYTTGRLTSEMVIKAAQMGIPVLVSRSGLTKMGHEIAEQVGITMIGRAVNKHYLLFTGAHRLVKPRVPA